jgi:hypothetical protein
LRHQRLVLKVGLWGNLFWDKPGNGYGFPVVSSLRDLLVGEDAIYM